MGRRGRDCSPLPRKPGAYAQLGTTWSTVLSPSMLATETWYVPTFPVAPSATKVSAPPSAAERVTPDCEMSLIVMSGPLRQENEVTPFVVTARPPPPDMLMLPDPDTVTLHPPCGVDGRAALLDVGADCTSLR